MKRIDKVYQGLVAKWQAATKEEILAKQGSAAKELATELGLTRANTSLELNKLVRQAQVVKIKTFPVRYLPMIVIEQHFGLRQLEVASLKDSTKKPTEPAVKLEQLAQAAASTQVNQVDPLELMIGYRGSLHNAVSQAKAALMYPPHGLHMMLLGQTGVGETYFANKIYAYAKFAQILNDDADDAPFVSFNCADYYNNPQLLMATLFGHAKGAYTGAEWEKAGLVEQANGGILLLDEVHRLPPEGQEMLFYFIDNGVFNANTSRLKQQTSKIN